MTTARSVITTVVGISAVSITACSSTPLSSTSGERIELNEFRTSPGEVGERTNGVVADGGRTEPPATSDSDNPVANVTPGQPVVIDSLVGQINGRPVFANDFFAPIDTRLRTQRRQLNPLQFDRLLEQEVQLRLREILENELLLAQAQLRLTPEQQQGLVDWLRRQEKNILAERGGTRETASAAIAREFGDGVTPDDLVDERRRMALIQLIYEEEIAPRVIVSWKDVEDAYRQNIEQFQPPGRVRITRIWLDQEQDAAQIADVSGRLKSGESFEAIRQSLPASAGGEDWHAAPEGGFDQITDLREEFRTKLEGLAVGDTTEPFNIELSGGRIRVVWLHIAEVDQPPGRTLYDPEVQRQLRRALTQQRRLIEEARYFNEQLGESVIEDLEGLRVKLIEIGRKRYG